MELRLLGNVRRQIAERTGEGRFRAFGFLPHLQLSSTWAFPGPLDSTVQIADSQIPFKILLSAQQMCLLIVCT